MTDSFTVLLFDVSDDALEHFLGLADLLAAHPVTLVMLTDRRPSAQFGKHRIVHIDEVPRLPSLSDYQAKYGFSLFKAITPDRWFFDYTSFYLSACFGRLMLDEVEAMIIRYVAAFDFFLSGECDGFYTGMADGFIPSLGIYIAAHYRKRVICTQLYHWWRRGVLLADRVDQTSSRIAERYEYLVAHPHLVDRQSNEAWFASKAVPLFRPPAETTVVRARVAVLGNAPSRPLSIRNLVIRRARYAVDKWLTRALIRFQRDTHVDRPFVLFPLHVAPEATLLGADPELADQFSLIKNLSMNLPWGVDLLVKVHPQQVDSRGVDFGFFRQCQSLPNVKLVAKEVDVRRLFGQDACLAVAVISGTVGFEAAMAGKPVIVFGHAVYGAARVFLKPADWRDFWTMMQSIQRGDWVHDEADLHALLQAMRDCAVTVPEEAHPTDMEDYLRLLSAEIIKQELVLARSAQSGHPA